MSPCIGPQMNFHVYDDMQYKVLINEFSNHHPLQRMELEWHVHAFPRNLLGNAI